MYRTIEIPQKLQMLYEGMTSAQLHQAIIEDNDQSKQALWYLLNVRMSQQLYTCYSHKTDGIGESARRWEDYLNDFYMYVYEYTPAQMYRTVHYYMLQNLKDDMKMEPVVYKAFQRFLTKEVQTITQAREEQPDIAREVAFQKTNNTEINLRRTLLAIACLSEETEAINKYIFFRTLCHKMGENITAIHNPTDEVAANFLNLSYGNYRVRSSRMIDELRYLLRNMTSTEVNKLSPATICLVQKLIKTQIFPDTLLSRLLRQAENALPQEMCNKFRACRKSAVGQKHSDFDEMATSRMPEMERYQFTPPSPCILPDNTPMDAKAEKRQAQRLRRQRRKEQFRHFVQNLYQLFS